MQVQKDAEELVCLSRYKGADWQAACGQLTCPPKATKDQQTHGLHALQIKTAQSPRDSCTCIQFTISGQYHVNTKNSRKLHIERSWLPTFFSETRRTNGEPV